jgi:hypothetical protein
MAIRDTGALQWLPGPTSCPESVASLIGPTTLDVKRAGERSMENPPAAFDVAGARNVTTANGLRASAKALEHPPEPDAARQSSTLLNGGVGSEPGLRAA